MIDYMYAQKNISALWKVAKNAFETLCQREDFDQLETLKIATLISKPLKTHPWLASASRSATKLAKKCSESYQNTKFIATPDMAEMATSYSVAQHRFSFFQDKLHKLSYLDFPTCGAGMDVIHYLSMNNNINNTLVVSDLSPLTTMIAKYNIQKLSPCCNIHFASADLMRPPFCFPEHSYCFLDPSRRAKGQRTHLETTPPLEHCFAYLERYAFAQIKLPPIFPMQGEEASEYIERGWCFEAIENKGEIKEITGHFSKTITPNQSHIIATKLNPHALPSSYTGNPEELIYEEHPLSEDLVLFIPSACLLKTNLFSSCAKQYGLKPIEGNPFLFGGENDIDTNGMFESFKLIKTMGPRPKKVSTELKKLKKNHHLELRKLGEKIPKDLYKACEVHLAKGNGEHLSLLYTRFEKSLKLLFLQKISN